MEECVNCQKLVKERDELNAECLRMANERLDAEWPILKERDALATERDAFKRWHIEANVELNLVRLERDDLVAQVTALQDTPGGKRIYGALNRIAELDAQLVDLKSKNAYLQQNYAEAKSDTRHCVEVLIPELKAQLAEAKNLEKDRLDDWKRIQDAERKVEVPDGE